MEKNNESQGKWDQYVFEPGDMIMLPIGNITSSSVFNDGFYDENNNYHEDPQFCYGFGNSVDDVIDDSDPDLIRDMLFVVKYIGNGLFEEMVSREKFVLDSELHIVECDDNGVLDNSMNTIAKDKMTYIRKLSYDNSKSKPDFIQELQKLIDLVDKYPMGITMALDSYTISDYTKRLYLKYTNEQRLEMLARIREAALKDAKITKEEIQNEINIHMGPTQDEIDMAYLDNQLLDFNNTARFK